MGRIIFSKYSNDRDRRFAIRTDIVQKGDGEQSGKRVTAGTETVAAVRPMPALQNSMYLRNRRWISIWIQTI